MSSVTKTGVYYGFAQVTPPRGKESTMRAEDSQVLPMVMSLGWNPFYKNERLTAEIHIMHDFRSDFYGYDMKALVLGYIRPELDYTSREALIDDIEFDKQVAINCLKRPAYQIFAKDAFFSVGGNVSPSRSPRDIFLNTILTAKAFLWFLVSVLQRLLVG
jgi:riboflavin kinase